MRSFSCAGPPRRSPRSRGRRSTRPDLRTLDAFARLLEDAPARAAVPAERARSARVRRARGLSIRPGLPTWPRPRGGLGRGGGREALVWARALLATARAMRARTGSAGFEIEDGLSGLSARLLTIAAWCEETVATMDFGFLYDRRRMLFAIGCVRRRAGPSYYDMLASRRGSRASSLERDVPTEHWFALDVPSPRRARIGAHLVVQLDVRVPDASLVTVRDQPSGRAPIRYGERNVPWGISESAFNARPAAYPYSSRRLAWAQARPCREPRRRAYASPLRWWIRRAAEHAGPHHHGAWGTLRFYEALTSCVAPSRREQGRRREGLHGPPGG
jgi:hypothetical protein